MSRVDDTKCVRVAALAAVGITSAPANYTYVLLAGSARVRRAAPRLPRRVACRYVSPGMDWCRRVHGRQTDERSKERPPRSVITPLTCGFLVAGQDLNLRPLGYELNSAAYRPGSMLATETLDHALPAPKSGCYPGQEGVWAGNHQAAAVSGRAGRAARRWRQTPTATNLRRFQRPPAPGRTNPRLSSSCHVTASNRTRPHRRPLPRRWPRRPAEHRPIGDGVNQVTK